MSESNEYKAVCLDKFMGRIHIARKSFRPLHKNELLIKVKHTTINFLDILFLRGEYPGFPYENTINQKEFTSPQEISFPIIPGFEGIGEVIDSQSTNHKHLIGKHVAVYSGLTFGSTKPYFEGLWAEYHYTYIDNLTIIDHDDIHAEKHYSYNISPTHIAFPINTLTALGMYDTAIKSGTKTVLQTNADSQVGRLFIRLCEGVDKIEKTGKIEKIEKTEKKEKIEKSEKSSLIKTKLEVINLVDNYMHVKELVKDYHADNIIVIDDEWELECKKLCTIMNTKLAFDSLGPTLTSKIFSFLPPDSTLFYCGNLLTTQISVKPVSELIFKGKKLEGFSVNKWIKSLSSEEYKGWQEFIKSEYRKKGSNISSSGSGMGGIFSMKISKMFKLDDIDQAVNYFTTVNLDGCVVIKI